VIWFFALAVTIVILIHAAEFLEKINVLNFLARPEVLTCWD
jgi:hypothetical protein